MKSFCVYLTIYKGNKLPQFYIGYTKTNKITDENYHGTVSSKRYKQIYKRETKEHPELFKTIIISLFETEIEAKNREYYIQKYFRFLKILFLSIYHTQTAPSAVLEKTILCMEGNTQKNQKEKTHYHIKEGNTQKTQNYLCPKNIKEEGWLF